MLQNEYLHFLVICEMSAYGLQLYSLLLRERANLVTTEIFFGEKIYEKVHLHVQKDTPSI